MPWKKQLQYSAHCPVYDGLRLSICFDALDKAAAVFQTLPHERCACVLAGWPTGQWAIVLSGCLVMGVHNAAQVGGTPAQLQGACMLLKYVSSAHPGGDFLYLFL